MKVALIHDYLGEFGGAERVLWTLSSMFPDAPIYTAFWRPGAAWDRFKGKDVRVSWAHHIPFFAKRLHSPLRFLAPSIWNSFDLSRYDLVISSASWYVTKGFGNRGRQGDGRRKTPVEICYCHTPPRWLYGYATAKEIPQYGLVRAYASLVGFAMRHYDWEAAQRVNYFIANSEETKRRIKKFYRRDSTVIYPPVDMPAARLSGARGEYFLIVSRLAQPKNVELAIRVANEDKKRLIIVGTGPDETRLRALAGGTVEFLGHVPDAKLPDLYAKARAFLALAEDEDFGITPVEAMSQGTPVIAYRGGGYTESVIDGKTGVFFDALTVPRLRAAMKQLDAMHISPSDCRKRAARFSRARFEKDITDFIQSVIG